ncbi:EthD family reductase [Mesorhizobium sp. BH1-1-5]|uniref:EthD domain-containing protein n=1 Tax=Mesorhizobium sp. BH1-1-5 TaxID=2876661 RepID=UPI001CCEB6B7|nr:EthD domain-containing protein [Mesorhizobium sp. BH1-1-5]MBZ9988195.1 EthD family reductase [Mesorhizobium sp. BH1-1-5]
MIKRVSLIRRKAGMSREEFFAHWTGPHAAIVRQMPGVRGLRFGKVQSWNPEEAAWDGVGEVWFDSMEDAVRAFAAEPYASRLVEDRKKFMGEAQSCFVTEHTAVAPPEGR